MDFKIDLKLIVCIFKLLMINDMVFCSHPNNQSINLCSSTMKRAIIELNAGALSTRGSSVVVLQFIDSPAGVQIGQCVDGSAAPRCAVHRCRAC